jgi:hypothetical protein
MTSELQEITEFFPAYDKRDPNPKKNYGIQGVSMRMLVKGPEGAVQFLLYTNWHLPHVAEEMRKRTAMRLLTSSSLRLFEPLPADLGYHSLKPMYEGQKVMGAEKFDFDHKTILKGATGEISIPTMIQTGTFTPCDVLDGKPCYYDGSSLKAERIFNVLLVEGSAGVWRELRKYYIETFRQESREEART